MSKASSRAYERLTVPDEGEDLIKWTDIWVKVEILGTRTVDGENRGSVALTFTPGMSMAAVKAILTATADSIKEEE